MTCVTYWLFLFTQSWVCHHSFESAVLITAIAILYSMVFCIWNFVELSFSLMREHKQGLFGFSFPTHCPCQFLWPQSLSYPPSTGGWVASREVVRPALNYSDILKQDTGVEWKAQNSVAMKDGMIWRAMIVRGHHSSFTHMDLVLHKVDLAGIVIQNGCLWNILHSKIVPAKFHVQHHIRHGPAQSKQTPEFS